MNIDSTAVFLYSMNQDPPISQIQAKADMARKIIIIEDNQ